MIEADKLRPDPLLSELATRYANREYVASMVLTPANTNTRHFKWLRFTRESAFTNVDTRGVPHAAPPTSRLDTELLDGSCENHHLAGGIDPSEQAEGQVAGINLQSEETEDITDKLLLRREVNVATTLRDTTKLTQNTTLANSGQWSHDDSDPVKEVLTRADQLDRKPNFLLVSQPVFTGLVTNKNIRNAWNLSGSATVSMEQLKRSFMVDEIIVAGAKVNTARQGQSVSLNWVWGKDAILGYRDPRPVNGNSVKRSTYGSLVTMGGGATGMPSVRIYRWLEPGEGTEEGVTKMKASTDYGVVIQAVTMAFLWKSAVA